MPGDSQIDPILTSRKSVPVLTEHSSPRPEPPSHCLDLSSDDDLSVTPEAQRPVMVLDASHLASSPHTREVDVTVAYEDSPARVVCHSPRHPEHHHRRLRRLTPGVASTNGAVSQNRGDIPHWSVPVQKVPTVGGSASKSPAAAASRNLFTDTDTAALFAKLTKVFSAVTGGAAPRPSPPGEFWETRPT